MSIRSSELDDERLGERYARRSADDLDPFNPNGDANAEINSDDGSLFPEVNEDGEDVANSNVNENREGGVAQGREEFPQAIDTTAYHGHATRARTRSRIQGDDSMATSRTPRNSAFAPGAPTFSPPAHNPPPNTVLATAAQAPSQIDYGQIAPIQGRVAHVGYSAIRDAIDKMDRHITNDERIKGELNWQKSIANLRPEKRNSLTRQLN